MVARLSGSRPRSFHTLHPRGFWSMGSRGWFAAGSLEKLGVRGQRRTVPVSNTIED
jgi:hypothetical protein